MQPASEIHFDQTPSDEVLRALKALYDEFRDPLQFIPASLMVQKRQGQIVEFKLKKAQKRLVELVMAQRAAGRPVRICIDKTRRVGMSAVIAAIIFQQTPFFEGQSALILAHEKKASRNLFNYYNRFEQHYKPFKGIGLPRIASRTASQDSGALRWFNRSQIEIATARNLDFSRSFDFRFLHLSEFAYYPNIRGLMTALVATVADDERTMIFKESTANGNNDFRKDCEDAMAGESDYEFFFAGCFEDEENWRAFGVEDDPVKFEKSLTDDEWSLIERYDLYLEQIFWRRRKLADFQGDLKRFDQEFPHSWEVSFQASGRQRFSPDLFTWMPTEIPFERGEVESKLINRQDKIVFTPHQYGELRVWRHFKRGGQYIGGVDVAKGVDINDGVGTSDPDWCVAEIGEREHGEQCMELHTRVEPTPFASYLYNLGLWCFQETGDWVYWVIEVEFSGGNGLAVCRELQRLGYPMDRIYFSETLDTATQKRKAQIGFVIRPNTRPLLISNHERYLINHSVTLHSKAAISEHQSFVKKANGKVEHEDQRHDDLVFGCMYMTWGFDNAPVFKLPKRIGQVAVTKYNQPSLSDKDRERLTRELRQRNSVRRSRQG